MILSPQDRRSPLWVKLLEHFGERLAAMRGSNDDMSKDATATAYLRGQISVYRALTDLDKDPPLL